MRYLYTGAATPLSAQTNAELSIGGNVSSSIIPNNKVGNLFGDISWKAIINRESETKAFVIENNNNQDYDNFIIGYQYPSNSYFKIEIAIVTITNNMMERITSSSQDPYYATFQEANIDALNNVNNSIVISKMLPNQKLGVWIKRTIIRDLTEVVTCSNSIFDEQNQIIMDPCCEQNQIIMDLCCEQNSLDIQIVNNRVDNILPITRDVDGNFVVVVSQQKVFEWIIFKTSTYPFDLLIGTTFGGRQILSTTVENSQPVQVLRYAEIQETIFFSGIPSVTKVTYKIT